MNNGYIVVIGSMNCDIIFLQDRLPKKGETYIVNSASMTPGGKGANQAVQCAKLGVETYMVAKVGNDPFGDFLIAELNRYGVNTTHVLRAKEKLTGLAAVNTLPDGVYHSSLDVGANYCLTVDDIRKKSGLIQGAAAVILQMEIAPETLAYAIDLAREGGVYIVLNAAPAREIDDAHLKKVDCLIVNEVEASFYLGQKIDSVSRAKQIGGELLKRTGRTLIITLGEQGSVLFNSNGVTHFPTDSAIVAVETTGSGDSYVGGFTTRIIAGDSDELACEFASRVSQYTITRIGGQPSMPCLKDLEAAESAKGFENPAIH